MIETIIDELRQAIEDITGCRKPEPERRFHKHDQYLSYSLKTPDFRKLMKKFRPVFLELALPERLDLASKLLQKHIGELGHVGIYILALSVEKIRPKHFPMLDTMTEDFRSWSHVDAFCIDVMAFLLLNFRNETIALLADWNRSTNRFKRRASVVVFTRDVAKSGRFTEEALQLCGNLIRDGEDIVRKGVGWALKDNMRSAPKRVLSYVKDLRRRGVSSTIILYAIRDLKPAERKEVLAIRKE